jgi:acyl-CoA oxidase
MAQVEKKVLPEAIGLTDAFGFTDYELDRFVCFLMMKTTLTVFASALGVRDGRAYENLFKRAQLEPLNSQDVVDGYKVRLLHL